MPAKGKQKTPEKAPASKESKAPPARKDTGKEKSPAQLGKAAQSGGGGDLAAEVKRLARELEAVKLELIRRPTAGGMAAARVAIKIRSSRTGWPAWMKKWIRCGTAWLTLRSALRVRAQDTVMTPTTSTKHRKRIITNVDLR